MKTTLLKRVLCGTAVVTQMLFGSGVMASSHMDAPLITLDPAANTTDVYAFVSENNGQQYLTTAVSVYPFEEPGIGPNKYNFDDNVLYEIHVASGDGLSSGKETVSYQFEFKTRFKNQNTILQSYLGPVEQVDDANQNLTQTYRVTRVRSSDGRKHRTLLGKGVVPPNNQGLLTRYYNQFDDGDQPAKGGVDNVADLDRYTRAGISQLTHGYQVFAGQRDDGFYADIQSIFDLDFTFGGPNKPFDSQGGFNLHTIALNIPLEEIGGDQQVVGVYASTSRRQIKIINDNPKTKGELAFGRWVQVGRQGNPLFNEALVAIRDKDRYSRSRPDVDAALFGKYALAPELAAVLIPLLGLPEDRLTNRTDIAGIFVPDVIKVDLSTGPARLAGANDANYSRLGVFGGDALVSQVQAGLPGFPAGTIPGGWPNGRRFGDDVVDIAVTAIISDLRSAPLQIESPIGDNVNQNDATYNRVFPYAATPLNGRNHGHHGSDL
ncbi:MAG: DUF4331 domain-containing protein [Pseudomonadales bacterium]